MTKSQVVDGFAVGVEATGDIRNVQACGRRHVDVCTQLEFQRCLVGVAQIVLQVIGRNQAVKAITVSAAKVALQLGGVAGHQAGQGAAVVPVGVLRGIQAANRHLAGDGHPGAGACRCEAGDGHRVYVVVRIGDFCAGCQVTEQTAEVAVGRHRAS